jgi:alanine racemase
MTATEPAAALAILEVDLAAIVANWRDLRARHQGAVAAVLKADAYGLGAAEVAPALLAAGCRHFFVALLDEALVIRHLVPGAMLAVLNGMVPGTEAIYHSQGIDPVLGSLDELARWAGRGPAILHVDTGMARLGLEEAELSRLSADPSLLCGLSPRYVMTHLISAEEPADPINAQQRARFLAARAMLPRAPASFANSSGIFLGADFNSDLARPGAAIYGLNPTPDFPNPMRCTLRLRARVLQVRDLQPGDSVGYNATWRAMRPSRIAAIGVGYADGWARALSSRGHALFDGHRVPLVGRVSMDLSTFDATDFPDLVAGCWLELIGPSHTPDAVAHEAGTNGYEILTSLGRRYSRVYR